MGSSRIGVVVSEKLEERVNRAIQETGLSKSELVRHGIQRELQNMEVDS